MWHVSLRTGKENDVLILAPANTPLQYPMRGFRVTPLNKTPIPGESDFSQTFISFLLISSINLDLIHSQMHLQKVTVRYALPSKMFECNLLFSPKLHLFVQTYSKMYILKYHYNKKKTVLYFKILICSFDTILNFQHHYSSLQCLMILQKSLYCTDNLPLKNK